MLVFVKSTCACKVQQVLLSTYCRRCIFLSLSRCKGTPSLQTSSFSRSCHKRIYYYWVITASADTHTRLTRANSCLKCDGKSCMLTAGLQLVPLPHHGDDRHTETRLAEPKCPASVPLVKNKHVPLEK